MAMTLLQTRVGSETNLQLKIFLVHWDLILQLQSVYFYVVEVAFH